MASQISTLTRKPDNQALTTTSTPAKSPVANISKQTSTPSPGTWRHPKFNEIARRQRQNAFDESNLRRIFYNGSALFLLASASLQPSWNKLLPDATTSFLPAPLTRTVLLALALLLIFNILQALRPLYRPKDEVTDVPLTPTQRSLLGLDPSNVSSQPQSPVTGAAGGAGTVYVTPPRYLRSPVTVGSSPRSNTPNSASSFIKGDRDLGRSESPWTTGGGGPNSPYDTPSSSPLYQKARALENARRRNSNQGTPSPLGQGGSGLLGGGSSVLGGSTTPSQQQSPLTGRAGVAGGLNNKWLYERGRRSSSSSSLLSSANRGMYS